MTATDDLMALLAKATAGEWEWDNEKGENAYGSGPNCGENYKVALIGAPNPGGKWMTLFDSHNSDAALVEEEYDEEGYGSAWDAVAYANAAAIVAAVNFCRTELPALIAERDALREALDECDRARVMIGARLDSMNEVQKECAINEAWHVLQRAIVKADVRAIIEQESRGE